MFKVLLGSKGDPNFKDGKTPLHLASENEHRDCIKLLLESETDQNAKDDNGWTLLHLASFQGNPDCVKLLLESHAEKIAKDESGMTALDLAREGSEDDWKRSDYLECVQLLIVIVFYIISFNLLF